jgi:hypothetical protein
MSACCNAAPGRKTLRAIRSARQILVWLLPSVALVFVPKCPACLAAYVALWTGVGMSFAAAAYLRWAWVTLCIGSLVFLAATRLRSRFDNNCNLNNMETEP